MRNRNGGSPTGTNAKAGSGPKSEADAGSGTGTGASAETTLRARVGETLDALLSVVRFGKFASVGAVGAVFDLTVSTLLLVGVGLSAAAVSVAGVNLVVPAGVLAKVAGAEVAIVVMFFINERWTFAAEGVPGRWPRRLAKSNLVRLWGLGVQAVVVWALGSLGYSLVVAGFDLWRLIPLPIAIGASVFFNYVAESVFTWRVGRS